MKTQTLIGVAASVALNLAVLAGLDWSAREAQVVPAGVVTIAQVPEGVVSVTQLEPVELAYAQLAHSAKGAQL